LAARRPGSTPSAAEPVALAIGAVGAAGDGTASGPDGQRVFVPFALPGEQVTAVPLGARGGGLAARLERVVEASPDRVAPPCPHFGACGGCTLQHWRAAPYLDWKAGLLRAALVRAGFPDPAVAPTVATPPGARRRMDLALRRVGGEVRVGLHRLRAPDVVDLAACPVLHPALAALIAPLRALLRGLAALRREGAAVANLLDAGADLLLRTDAEPGRADRARLIAFARAHDLPRISWARGDGEPEPIAVLRPAVTSLSGVAVAPPPGAFLQASAAGEAAIVAAVRAGLPPAMPARARIVELYAGCGTLSFALARLAPVRAFEGDPAALAALRAAAARAGLAGRIAAQARDLARQPLGAAELAGAAAVVLDPPRAGAAPQMAALAAAGPGVVVYVSCDPVTLGRDAAELARAGYALAQATPIDQFLWSARVESVCVFRRAPRPLSAPLGRRGSG
jgi:23S rRNA (uracil1939-C5)-methyltransferase